MDVLGPLFSQPHQPSIALDGPAWVLFIKCPPCPPFEHLVPSQDAVGSQGRGLVVMTMWRGRWEQNHHC